MVAYRIRRYGAAEACFYVVAALLVALLGTGVGLGAARLQDDSSPSHRPIQKIVRPLEDGPPLLNRDRSPLDE